MLLSLIVCAAAGLLARLIIPGDKSVLAYVLSAFLGVAGAFLATFMGQAVGWYLPGESTGLLGALLGAAMLIGVWQLVA